MEHPVGVQHRLLDAAGGEEAAGAFEVALALEVEAPGGRLGDLSGAARVEVEQLLHQLALEDREVLGVAVGEVGVVVDAPVRGDRGVALVHDGGQVAVLGKSPITWSDARTSRSILSADGLLLLGAGPPIGP